MYKYKLVIPGILLAFMLVSLSINAQETGGPYTADANTVLLMHFDGNLSNSSSLSNDGNVNDGDISFSSEVPSGLGQCLHNNGTSYISIAHNDNLNLSGDWTIEAWINLQEFRVYPNDPYILRKPGDTNDYQSNFAIQIVEAWGNVFHAFYFPETDYRISVNNTAPNLNQWYHVAFIRDVSKSIFSLTVRDSNWEIVSYNSNTFSENNVLLSAQNIRIGENFKGYIDEVRVSNVVRDFSETPVNSTPVVSNIPNQTIKKGSSFTTINLDYYVSDSDNPDNEITWSFTGNTVLDVTINSSRVASVTPPNTNWTGSETVTFTATDPSGATASDNATFKINDSNTATVDQTLINKKVSALNLHPTKFNLPPFTVEIETLSSADYETQKPASALSFDAGFVNANGKVFVSAPTTAEQTNLFPDIDQAALYYTCQSFLQYYYQATEMPIWFKTGFAAYESDMRFDDADIKTAYNNYGGTLTSFDVLNNPATFAANNGLAISYMFGEFIGVFKGWGYEEVKEVNASTIIPESDWYNAGTIEDLFEYFMSRYFKARILETNEQERLKLGKETEHFKHYYREAEDYWLAYFPNILEEAITEYKGLLDFETFEKFSSLTMPICNYVTIGGGECVNLRYTSGTAWSSGIWASSPDTDNSGDIQTFSHLIRHELAHLVQAQLGARNMTMTAWLNEGFAEFMSRGPSTPEEKIALKSWTEKTLNDAINYFGHLPTFEDTKVYPGQTTVDYYVLGQIMQNFIYETSGYSAVREVIINPESGIANMGFSSVDAFMAAYYHYLNVEYLQIEEPNYFTNYDVFITKLTNLTSSADSSAQLNEFWDALIATGNFPFAIDTELAFLYRGSTDKVNWAGDFNGWDMNVNAGIRMGVSDIWLLEKVFPADATSPYKIILNGNEWLADPNNPYPIDGVYGNSLLRMPNYVIPPETIFRPEVPRGTLSDNILKFSTNLNYSSQYRVYTPAGYNALSNLPTIYITDGHESLDDELGKMVIVLDNLISDQLIAPVIAVFLDPRDPDNLSYNRRGDEYRSNIDFVNYVTQELIPDIDAAYKTNPSADVRAMMGNSYGGYNAAYFCVKAPDYFHLIGINSAYLHPREDYTIYADMEAANLDEIKLYMSYGTFDAQGERYYNDLKTIFDQKGKEFKYSIVNDGHTWNNWSGIADDALEYFFAESEKYPPVVSDIPDQTINEGGSFTTIQLDNFVSDPDNVDSQITWTFSGNADLSVAISGNRVATVSVPDGNWSGSETITFTATDPDGASDNDDTVFTVTSVNDAPVVSDIPDQTIDEGSIFTAINLNDFVIDPDNEDSQITWTFSGNADLSVAIAGNRAATVSTPDENWYGSETITFTATDPGNATGNNAVIFTVNPVDDPPVISGAPELVEFVSDTSVTIDIWTLVSDIESPADLLVYDFRVNSDSILLAYDDAAGMLTLSAELEFEGEGDLVWSVIDIEETVKDTIHIVVEKAAISAIDEESIVPEKFALYHNYPNPFNPATVIRYELADRCSVSLKVFDLSGSEIAELVNEFQNAGAYKVRFNAQLATRHAQLISGVYFYTLRAGDFLMTKKMILLK